MARRTRSINCWRAIGDHMKYRMIAFDLDYTLLDSQRLVSRENRDAVGRAQQAGILIVPCTGREWHTGKAIGLDHLPPLPSGVFKDGAIVCDVATGQVSRSIVFADQLAHRVLDRISGLPVAILICRLASDGKCDYLPALVNLGIAYHRGGMHSSAIAEFERAAELDPSDPSTYLYLAAAENALGHLDRAERALFRALELDPRQAGAHYSLAVIHLKRNNLANAMAEMELELSVNPGHRETRVALGALRERIIPR